MEWMEMVRKFVKEARRVDEGVVVMMVIGSCV